MHTRHCVLYSSPDALLRRYFFGGGRMSFEAGIDYSFPIDDVLLDSVEPAGGWQCSIAVIMEDCVDDVPFAALLGKAIECGSRRRFSHLSMRSTVQLARDLAVQPRQRPRDPAMCHELFDAIGELLLARHGSVPKELAVDDLPMALLVRVVKYQLLASKAADQSASTPDSDPTARRTSKAMMTARQPSSAHKLTPSSGEQDDSAKTRGRTESAVNRLDDVLPSAVFGEQRLRTRQ